MKMLTAWILMSPKVVDLATREIDELYENMLRINRFYCMNKDYRIACSLHGIQNRLFEEKANSFIEYHFNLGINDRCEPTKIYDVGMSANNIHYSASQEIVKSIWKTIGCMSHVQNNDCRIISAGYVRMEDKGLNEICTRNYLYKIKDYYKCDTLFAVIIANAVITIPECRMVIMETKDEPRTVELANRNLMDGEIVYKELMKTYYACNYLPNDYDSLINLCECSPLIIKVNKEKQDFVKNFKDNIVVYARDLLY